MIGIDTLLPFKDTKRRTIMTTPVTSDETAEAAHGLFSGDGIPVTRIRDSAGFVVQRVICAIVNIASDIAQQAIATPEDIDTAVRLGLGYPRGPLALGDFIGPALLLEALKNMQSLSGDPRYRPSPWLRRRAGLGVSLLIEEPRTHV